MEPYILHMPCPFRLFLHTKIPLNTTTVESHNTKVIHQMLWLCSFEEQTKNREFNKNFKSVYKAVRFRKPLEDFKAGGALAGPGPIKF